MLSSFKPRQSIVRFFSELTAVSPKNTDYTISESASASEAKAAPFSLEKALDYLKTEYPYFTRYNSDIKAVWIAANGANSEKVNAEELLEASGIQRQRDDDDGHLEDLIQEFFTELDQNLISFWQFCAFRNSSNPDPKPFKEPPIQNSSPKDSSGIVIPPISEGAIHGFVYSDNSEDCRLLLQLVWSVTENKFDSSSSSNFAIFLLVALQNDLLRRFLQSPQQERTIDSSFGVFVMMVLEKSASYFSNFSVSNSDVLNPLVSQLLPYLLVHLSSALPALLHSSHAEGQANFSIISWAKVLGPQVARVLQMLSKAMTSAKLEESKYAGDPVRKKPVIFTTVIDSLHPYDETNRKTFTVRFPSTVSFMVAEFDNRSCTGQSEDNLQIFSDAALSKRISGPFYGPPIKKSLRSNQQSHWPPAALILPGNRAYFSFETSSNYAVHRSLANRWGFRCILKGYRKITHAADSLSMLLDLEEQLTYLGAVCAESLIVAPCFSNDSKTMESLACLERPAFFRGLQGQYLSSNYSPLNLDPKSKADEYCASLLTDIEDEAKESENAKESRLVNWLRKSCAMVEPLNCVAAGPGAKYATAGLKSHFRVHCRDEFDRPVLSLKESELTVTIHKGSYRPNASFDFDAPLRFNAPLTTGFEKDLTIFKAAFPSSPSFKLPFTKQYPIVLPDCDRFPKSVYVFSGDKGSKLYKLDVAEKKWHELTNSGPSPQNCVGVRLKDGRLAFLGYTGRVEFMIYSPRDDTWSSEFLHFSLGQDPCAAVNPVTGDAHFIGGRDGSSEHHYVFNPVR